MGLLILVLFVMFALLIVCVGCELRWMCVSSGGDVLVIDVG